MAGGLDEMIFKAPFQRKSFYDLKAKSWAPKTILDA